VILWVPHQVTMAVFALLVLAGAWEWAAFPGLTSVPARSAYVIAIAAALAACWFAGRTVNSWILGAAIVWWLIAFLWILFLPTRMSRVLGVLAGFVVLVPAWVALVALHEREPNLVLFVLLLVVAADVGAYFGGRKFGRHKLAPKVSPGKTWEGVFGGFVAAALMAFIGVAWFKVSTVPFLAVCAIVVVASIVGDLTESLFKRHAGLKDSGSLLPGHGGVLDRVDSVTAAAPVFLVSLEFLGLLA
jgi:phosphatidate cytidylyltransferase